MKPTPRGASAPPGGLWRRHGGFISNCWEYDQMFMDFSQNQLKIYENAWKIQQNHQNLQMNKQVQVMKINFTIRRMISFAPRQENLALGRYS